MSLESIKRIPRIAERFVSPDRSRNLIGIRAALFLAVLVTPVFSSTVFAQNYERHGEVSDVNVAKNEITVTMNGAYYVDVGISGKVIGSLGREAEGAYAVIKVVKVDGKKVTCTIEEWTTRPSTDMYVMFDAIQTVSTVGTLVVTATPAGARITLDGTDRGEAPRTFKLESGLHSISVSAPGYATQRNQYEIVAPETRRANYTLVRVARFGSLYLMSEPAVADVYVGDVLKGTTNLLVETINAGVHQIRIVLKGFSTVDTTMIVRANELVSASFRLKPAAKDTTLLSISLNSDGNLEFVVHFKRRMQNKSDRSTGILDPGAGEMVLVVTAPIDDKIVRREPVSLRSGVPVTLSYNLKAPVVNGLLAIQTDPGTADYVVTGPDGYYYEDSTDADLSVPPGRYKVIFSKEGYDSKEIEETVSPGIQTLVEVSLTQISFTAHADIEFVRVRADDFNMGSATGDANELPVFGVTLTTDFFMSQYEITQGQYEDIMGENPSSHRSGRGLPVEKVTWNDAVYLANVLSEYEGLKTCYTEEFEPKGSPYRCEGYRLPTEAEWEYAAKLTYRFSDGVAMTDKDLLRYGWFASNSEDRTHGTGLKRATETGIFDLLGNVREWVHDWYAPNYKLATRENPVGPVSGEDRVVRGGSFKSEANLSYITRRVKYRPNGPLLSDFGIRLVRSAL